MRLGWLAVLVMTLEVSAAAAPPPRSTSTGDTQPAKRPAWALVPAGELMPFFAPRPPGAGPPGPRQPVAVPAFELQTAPVSNREMLAFVTAAPAWRRSRVARAFAEPTYLTQWRDDLSLGDAAEDAPVTHVSWFAAQAYCQWLGASLPTTTQWEYALADAGRGKAQRQRALLDWYAQPSGQPVPAVAQRPANGYGLYDLVGLVWEWTLDFSADLLGSEPRTSGTKEEAWFCGAGSLGALDPGDYATFMRYSFRASLRARFTTGNLGFRCARPAPTPPTATAPAPRRPTPSKETPR